MYVVLSTAAEAMIERLAPAGYNPFPEPLEEPDYEYIRKISRPVYPVSINQTPVIDTSKSPAPPALKGAINAKDLIGKLVV